MLVYTYMTKTLEFENAEEIFCNSIHGGTFCITMFNDDATIIAVADVEHNFDDCNIHTTASVTSFKQLDGNDRITEPTFTDKELEKIIEKNKDADEFFIDRIQGLAE